MREVVLPDRGEARWDGRMTHNPTVLRHGGKFLLFYIGSTFRGTRADAASLRAPTAQAQAQVKESYAGIRIGLAVSSSVMGPWIRGDAPILMPRPGRWDASITTNPAPCLAPDGSLYLYYRSNTPDGCRLGVSRAEAPRDGNWLGARFERLCDEPVMRFHDGGTLEDPFVWHNGTCFEMLAKDLAASSRPSIMAASTAGRRTALRGRSRRLRRRIRARSTGTTAHAARSVRWSVRSYCFRMGNRRTFSRRRRTAPAVSATRPTPGTSSRRCDKRADKERRAVIQAACCPHTSGLQ